MCAPLRSRMLPETIEQLTVVQQYIEKGGKSVKVIKDELLKFIEAFDAEPGARVARAAATT